MIAVLRGAVIAIGALAAVTVQAASVTLTNPQDRLSYALGIETGRSFKTHDVQVNPQVFAQGMSDGITGNKPLMTDSDVRKEITNFQQETLSKMQQKLKDSGAKNQKAENDFLQSNKTKSGMQTTASGLQYKVDAAGQGANPTDNDVVTVDYEGKLLNGKVFDSSYQRGKPASFPVAAVISGWQEALKLMKPGATYELFIPSKLAYGEQGAGGIIGPNELLIFKVHLISVKPASPADKTQPGS